MKENITAPTRDGECGRGE